MAPPSRAEIEREWRMVHTVWLIECALAVAVWIGLPLTLGGGAPVSSIPPVVVPALFVAAVFELAIGYWFKRRALAGEMPAPSSQAGAERAPRVPLAGASLFAVMTASGPVVLGVVAYVIVRRLDVLSGFCALALIGLLFLRPNLEEWEAAVMRGIGPNASRRPRG
jgi:hypothetical protein